MAHLGAFFVFEAMAALTWAVALALYQAYVGGPELRENPDFWSLSAGSITLVTFSSFVPFPAGDLLALAFWWLTARNFFELPLRRALGLFLILAALTVASRWMLLGALADFR